MELVIVTGLSGAGKSTAVDVLEDIGYFCVDNVPPDLITPFVSLLLKSGEESSKTAIVTDIRSGRSFDTFSKTVDFLKENNIDYRIIFMDASDDSLIKRYKETRRKHPLAYKYGGSVESAINAERTILQPLRLSANYVIDTTDSSIRQTKNRVSGLFIHDMNDVLQIQCLSFGFKYGIPKDADLVLDVRCLPNPFYIDELKHLTGNDSPVHDYVMNFKQSQTVLDKFCDLLDYMLPLYRNEGKSLLLIAVGCTGGKHRSVTIANEIGEHLLKNDIQVTVTHRDITK